MLGVQGVQAGDHKVDGRAPIYGMVRGQEDANNDITEVIQFECWDREEEWIASITSYTEQGDT